MAKLGSEFFFACMKTASMSSETCAKTVCSEVFGIFSRTLLTKQVPDPSSTGHRILEYRLCGVFLWVIADAWAWMRPWFMVSCSEFDFSDRRVPVCIHAWSWFMFMGFLSWEKTTGSPVTGTAVQGVCTTYTAVYTGILNHAPWCTHTCATLPSHDDLDVLNLELNF